MHPATEHVLKFFTYDHLPPHLQKVSKPFYDLANYVAGDHYRPPEAKDAAVRAQL